MLTLLDNKRPNVPSNLTVSNLTANSLTLSWGAVSYSEGIENYEVFRDRETLGVRKGTSFADNGLIPETDYEYQVKSIGSNGLESELSEPILVTTIADEPDEELED